MKEVYFKEEIETKEQFCIFDITEMVFNKVKASEIKNGHLIIQALHTTVGLYLNECEKRLFEDFKNYLYKNVKSKGYMHDDIEMRDCPADEPINGHSHIKSAFYSNPSLSFIISNGKIVLGRYQRILFMEFDGPCPRKNKSKREIALSIIGE